MRWRLIVLLRTKWKVPLDNIIPASLTTMPTTLDFSQEPHVVLELSAGQQQEFQITCVQEQQKPCSLVITLHEHAVCTLVLQQAAYLPGQLAITVNLVGEHARVAFVGRVVTTQKQQALLHVTLVHSAPYTHSVFDLKGVAYDASVYMFEGRVLLQQTAYYAQATMHHKHLVVGGKSRVVSQPQLEALHDSVQCTHGSAISYVDQEQLFYIMSRGISPEQAQALLIDSFLS